MNDKCKGWFGPRCNFEPRYDANPITPEHIRAMGQAYPLGGMSFDSASTYVCDVCTACGEVRERTTLK